MSPRIAQGCALVLLLAMMLAIGAGMIAWGPITLQPGDHAYADERQWLGMPTAFNTLANLPQLAFSIWGAAAVWRGRWPRMIRHAWLAFFGFSALMALLSFGYHLQPTDTGYALTHWFAAAALLMLGLAFLSERMDPLFGSGFALLGAFAISSCGALWWLTGEWSTGHGDLRALIFLQCLPLLLIPAGALTLPGEHTSLADWLAALCMYMAARSAGWADAAMFEFTGWLSGHSLMHLLLGAVAASLAYRATVALESAPLEGDSLLEPAQRITSLNTSS